MIVMPEGPLLGDLELYIRNAAVEVAFALKSRTLSRVSGPVLGYAVQTGPGRGPLILWGNGDLQLKGPLPMELDRAVISELNHIEGRVSFIGTNKAGVPASLEIRSTNPSY